jgi:hypothetical protein
MALALTLLMSRSEELYRPVARGQRTDPTEARQKLEEVETLAVT